MLAGPKQVSADVVPKSKRQPVTSAQSGTNFCGTKTKNEDKPGNENLMKTNEQKVSSSRIDVLGFMCCWLPCLSFGSKKQNFHMSQSCLKEEV